MKTRQAFVANSSSSSFICDTCKEEFSGWDASPRQFEHYQCRHGHIFCEEELLNPETVDEDGWDEENEEGYEIAEKNCPCCNFVIITDEDMKLFLKLKYGILEDEVFAVVKEQNKRRKKLYPQEYVTYVCMKKNTNVQDESDDLRFKLKNYSELHKWKGNHL